MPTNTVLQIEGPGLSVEPLLEYRARLKKEVRSTWYHVSTALEPGAFARTDSVVGPSWGDAIFTSDLAFTKARSAYLDIIAERKPEPEAKMYLGLLKHEFCHCYLPHEYQGTMKLDPEGPSLTYKQAQARYSHPGDALPALIHCVQCGFAVNCFSRVFRWRDDVPPEVNNDFLKWFGQQVARRDVRGVPLR